MHESSARDQPRRTIVAVIVFLLCCLLSSAHLIVDAPTPGHLNDENKIARRSDQRFAALRPYLPQHGVIGYIGEPGADAMGDYYLTQYALAPLVVDHSANHRFVVGNFPSSSPAASASANLRLVKNFGDGVLLLANEEAR